MPIAASSVEARFVRARDRGCEFLVKQQRADGGVGLTERGVADYYKFITAYLVCGASAEAHRLCHWIRTYGLTPEGDFVPRPEEAKGYAYIYYNSWVIIGAQRQGHFDLSRQGMNFVSGFWDPESGGFYSNLTERTAQTEQDLWVTSGAGQAALYLGHIDIAQGVARWMKRLIEFQPDYPRLLYCVYSRSHGVHTTFDPRQEIRYVLDPLATRDQFFFNLGIAGGFLASLYKATGEREWLNLACEYMRPAECASDYLFRTMRAGKVGWAASLLYSLTGEGKYREMAIRIGEHLIATQTADGCWDSTMGAQYRNDVTAEMVIWLDEIHQAVGNGTRG